MRFSSAMILQAPSANRLKKSRFGRRAIAIRATNRASSISSAASAAMNSSPTCRSSIWKARASSLCATCSHSTAMPSCRIFGRRHLRGYRISGTKRALHQYGIEPAPVLPPDRGHCTDQGEAELLMQPDRTFVVAVANHRDHLAELEAGNFSDKMLEQARADAATLNAVAHINRIFDRVV